MKKNKIEKKVFTNSELAQIHLFLSRGDLPLKYSYKTGEGARAWINYENLIKEKYIKHTPEYDSELLFQNKEKLIGRLKNNNYMVIFDFGPGEGRPVEKFLKEISKTKKIFYHGFDISQSVLDANKKRIEKISKNIEYSSDVIDFEDSNFFNIVMLAKKKYDNQDVLALLIGSTVGNFQSINGILKNMMSPFSTNDRFIIGVAKADLKNKKWLDSVVKGYSSGDVKKITTATLNYLNFPKNSYNYYGEFNEKEGVVDMIAEFKKNLEIEINRKKIFFEKDQKIRIGKSEKVDDVKMVKIFGDLNLRIVNMSTSEDDNYVQFCLSNKNFF